MLSDNGTLKNKQSIWQSKKNVRWQIVKDPNNPGLVTISGEKVKVPKNTDSDVNKVRPRY